MKKLKKLTCVCICGLLLLMSAFLFNGCSQGSGNNNQNNQTKYSTYRKITFLNLTTGKVMYTAEGYFTFKLTVNDTYQLKFKVGADEYKADYFSVSKSIVYVIEEIENITGNPYNVVINWYTGEGQQ